MQTEYYSSNRDEMQRLEEDEQMNARLQEMQDILEHLETKFDRTEKELHQTKKENLELESELQK